MDDVILIGAGIIGASTAYNLAKRGRRVRLIDRDAPGNGCSFGNAGLIAVDHVAPLANPDTLAGVPRMLLESDGPLKVRKLGALRMLPWMLRFAAQSRPRAFERNTRALASLITRAGDAWARTVAEVGLQDLYRDVGSLYVYEKPVDAQAERRSLALLDEHGVQYETLDANAVRRAYLPALSERVSHARYFPRMASVASPQRVVERLSEAAARLGVRYTRSDVTALRLRSDGLIEVATDEKKYPAKHVVICAGVGSAALLKMLGHDIPLTKERGYHVQLRTPDTSAFRVPVSFVERGFTCTPMAQGLRLAGTVELGAGASPDWRRADILASHFAELFPQAGEPSVATRWVGDRPTLPDYLPMLGSVPGIANAFVATGHQHLGLTLGALSGELMSQLVTRESMAVDLTPFRTDRFA